MPVTFTEKDSVTVICLICIPVVPCSNVSELLVIQTVLYL